MDKLRSLREIEEGDLHIFFSQQLDEEANRVAAFTAADPADREAFMARWARIAADETITGITILVREQVAGHVLCHSWFGRPEVTYWLGRAFWGKGIATQALLHLLAEIPTRPLYARAAADNVASLRVLEKCGFRVIGQERAFAQGRGEEIDELILRLD